METIKKKRAWRNTLRSIFKRVKGIIVVNALLTSWVLFVAACTPSENNRNPETAITADIDQLIEDYFTAYNNYDADAVRSLVTEGYELIIIDSSLSGSARSCDAFNAEQMFDYVEGFNKQNEYQFERVGEPIMSGSASQWFVSQVIFETTKDDPDGFEFISTFLIVEQGEQLKIDRDVVVYDPSQ